MRKAVFPARRALNDYAEIRLLRTGPTLDSWSARSFESDEQGPDSGWVRVDRQDLLGSGGPGSSRYRGPECRGRHLRTAALMGDANGPRARGSRSVPKP